MSVVFGASLLVFALSAVAIALFFFVNPLLIRISRALRGELAIARAPVRPPVSVVVVCRNARNLLAKKLDNLLRLEYPEQLLEIVVYSDGSTDGTEEAALSFPPGKVRLLFSAEHRGKNHGINQAVAVCGGEILLFTDVDTDLDPAALGHLLPWFADPRVGGVCGDKVIYRDATEMGDAQVSYNNFANGIKLLETRIGSITSNDGTLFAMRRELFRPLPPDVTDDLCLCLSVVGQGRLFLFEPRARSFISAPSSSIRHELARRQRIVNQDLRSVAANAGLLNPHRHGGYAFRLLVNKVVRRLVPVALVTLFASSLVLAFRHPLFAAVFALQAAFYALALLHLLVFRRVRGLGPVTRLSSLAFYFTLGNYGALLGLGRFLLGQRVTKW